MAKKKSQPEELLVPEEVVEAPTYEVDDERTQLSPIEALIGVVIRPKATFERMRDAARGHWWVVAVAAILALLLSATANARFQEQADPEQLQKQLDANGDGELTGMEQQQYDQAMLIANSPLITTVLPFAGGVFALAFGYGARVALLFFMGMALGGRASFKQVWRMSVWTTLPDVLRSVVGAIVIFVTGSPNAPGLSYMLTNSEIKALPYLATFLKSVDIYLVWSLVLLGIGLLVTSQLSRTKSAVVTLAYWLFTLVFALGLTALNQALAGMVGVG